MGVVNAEMNDRYHPPDQRKQPLNERLAEMIRGERKNIFDVLFAEEELSQANLRPICLQYNLRQKPKPSLGIAFYNTRTRTWLAIQPRHTIEMRMIIRGTYTESTLPLMLEQVYDEELDVLASLESPNNFQELFDTYYGTSQRGDSLASIAREFWNRDWRIIRDRARRCVAYRREQGFEVSQWIFPKGRPLEGEEPFHTARREVEEETGIRILFENPPTGKSCTREDPFEINGPARTGLWEPCHIDFPSGIEELTPGFICREFVFQLHSDISGRVYNTTLWICVFDLEKNPEIPLSPQNYESRGGIWLSEERLWAHSRVVELFHRCRSLLIRNYPFLTV